MPSKQKDFIIRFLKNYFKDGISTFSKSHVFKCQICNHIFTIEDTEKWVSEYASCPNCKSWFCILEKDSNERTLRILQEKLYKNLGKEDILLTKMYNEITSYSKNILKSYLKNKKASLEEDEEFLDDVSKEVAIIFLERIKKRELYIARSFGSFIKYKIIQILYSNKNIKFEYLSDNSQDEKLNSRKIDKIFYRIECNKTSKFFNKIEVENILNNYIDFFRGSEFLPTFLLLIIIYFSTKNIHKVKSFIEGDPKKIIPYLIFKKFLKEIEEV